VKFPLNFSVKIGHSESVHLCFLNIITGSKTENKRDGFFFIHIGYSENINNWKHLKKDCNSIRIFHFFLWIVISGLNYNLSNLWFEICQIYKHAHNVQGWVLGRVLRICLIKIHLNGYKHFVLLTFRLNSFSFLIDQTHRIF